LLFLGGYLYNRLSDNSEKVMLETGYLKNQIDAAKAAAPTTATTVSATTTVPETATTTIAPTKPTAP
jgi:hypothetical protein